MAHEFCKELLKEEKKHNSISIRVKVDNKTSSLSKSRNPWFDIIIYHVAEPTKILKRESVNVCCTYMAKSEVLSRCRNFFTPEWYTENP